LPSPSPPSSPPSPRRPPRPRRARSSSRGFPQLVPTSSFPCPPPPPRSPSRTWPPPGSATRLRQLATAFSFRRVAARAPLAAASRRACSRCRAFLSRFFAAFRPGRSSSSRASAAAAPGRAVPYLNRAGAGAAGRAARALRGRSPQPPGAARLEGALLGPERWPTQGTSRQMPAQPVYEATKARQNQ
jgi:hypothetical protein